jgi:D-aminopeptidase
MARARLRDLGVAIGTHPTGPHNAITDVPGVLVGHTTLIRDEPRVARTGVTVILPRADVWEAPVFAGYHSFNGCGEMTGLIWLQDFGTVEMPIAITSTASVGTVWQALVAHGLERGSADPFAPVVAETHDGQLSDLAGFHVTAAHVEAALAAASGGPVAEGNVGGGTGMICHEFKGGIGTASRVANTRCGSFTVGALVQSNYGERGLLRVDGVPVGREIDFTHTPSAWDEPHTSGGSIIIVVATDAPLISTQCDRLARRATVGLARVGGTGHNGSGDIFLAFATGNRLRKDSPELERLAMLPNSQIDELFDATAEAVEEAILNSLTAAETMTGFRGRMAHALPLDELERVWRHYRGR